MLFNLILIHYSICHEWDSGRADISTRQPPNTQPPLNLTDFFSIYLENNLTFIASDILLMSEPTKSNLFAVLNNYSYSIFFSSPYNMLICKGWRSFLVLADKGLDDKRTFMRPYVTSIMWLSSKVLSGQVSWLLHSQWRVFA